MWNKHWGQGILWGLHLLNFCTVVVRTRLSFFAPEVEPSSSAGARLDSHLRLSITTTVSSPFLALGNQLAVEVELSCKGIESVVKASCEHDAK